MHLGRPFGWLPPGKREERRLELREIWKRAIEEAISRQVDAVLVPGDLFDGEEVDAETVNRAVECVSESSCPPLFIAPGNHDCFSRSNTYYDNDKLVARGQPPWPEHVHIFQSPGFTSELLAGRPEIELWGRCVHANVDSDERVLVELPSRDPGRLHVGLLHGSREGFRIPGKRLTAPFTDPELLEAGFDYVALGHYHEPSEIRDERSMLRAAYSGSPAALARDETGPHGALVVSLVVDLDAPEGARVVEATSERVGLDKRRLLELTIDLSGCGSSESARERFVNALEQASVDPGDLVYARLIGRPRRGVNVVPSPDDFDQRIWFVHFNASALRPDYDLDAYRSGADPTTEERFARSLLEEIDNETDPARRAHLEAALYYGLDALTVRKVTPSYEWGVE